jgi:transposase
LRPTRWTRPAARSGTKRAAPAHKQAAKELKGARFALWKNPGRLTERHRTPTAQAGADSADQQAAVPRLPDLSAAARDLPRHLPASRQLLDAWLAWGRRCRLAPFAKLAKPITNQRLGIEAAIRHGLSNARIEQVNTQLRLITRRSYGFHTLQALIALAMLSLGDLCPPLPQ